MIALTSNSRRISVRYRVALTLLVMLLLCMTASVIYRGSNTLTLLMQIKSSAFPTDLNNPNTAADDPRLLQSIRTLFLERSFFRQTAGVHLKDTSDGQSGIVDDIFNRKRNGFFVESGAYNGLFLSNTLFLERERGWSGLLIEPDSLNFSDLRDAGRKALLSHSCLSTKTYPSKMIFERHALWSKILSYPGDSDVNGFHDILEVQCFPLQSLLLAANISSVDYLSLDVEGQELNVLKTIPWTQVDIKVLSVEHRNVPEGKEAVIEYMVNSGYEFYQELTDLQGVPNDVMFVKKDFTTNE